MALYSYKEMDKFREIARFFKGFDSSIRSGSSSEAIDIVIAMVNRDRPVVESLTARPSLPPLEEEDVPLVRLGQGDYTKDIH